MRGLGLGSGTGCRTLLRGVSAAIGSGLAFWAISGIWTDPAADPSYLWRFACWTFAFLPGFLALLLSPSDHGAVTRR